MPKHRARACRGSRHGIGYWKRKRQQRGRIAPAIDDVLSPAAGSEKAHTPHQSTPVNRKREGWLHVPEFHGLRSPLAHNKRLPKGPVTKERHESYKLRSWKKWIPG